MTPDEALDAIHEHLNSYGQQCWGDPDSLVERVGELMQKLYNEDPAEPPAALGKLRLLRP